MSNPKWQVGPVKLANGWDGNILLFCEHRKVYLGTYKVPGGGEYVIEWKQDGTSHPEIKGMNLAPPPKKTVRVKGWVNVYANGRTAIHDSKKSADRLADSGRFACIEIDREVEEGEGLS